MKPCRGGCCPRATAQNPAGPCGRDEGGGEQQRQGFPPFLQTNFPFCSGRGGWVPAQGLRGGGTGRLGWWHGTVSRAPDGLVGKATAHRLAPAQRAGGRTCLGASSPAAGLRPLWASQSPSLSYHLFFIHLQPLNQAVPSPPRFPWLCSHAPPPAQCRRPPVSPASLSSLRPEVPLGAGRPHPTSPLLGVTPRSHQQKKGPVWAAQREEEPPTLLLLPLQSLLPGRSRQQRLFV